MIDYNRISDKEYFNNQIDGIAKTNDSYILANELKMLSQKIYDGKVDPVDARIILGAIKTRQAELTGKKYGNNSNVEKGRSMVMSPTAVSNRNGSASIIFLVASVAATTVMYTLLAIAHFIK